MNDKCFKYKMNIYFILNFISWFHDIYTYIYIYIYIYIYMYVYIYIYN